jgi:dihydroorotase
MNPPLRTAEDVAALKVGLADGTIDVIATDHAPHSLEEKVVEFIYAPFGVTGLETAVGLTISQLIRTEVLSPVEAVAKMSLNPASILGVTGGELRVGSPADITIVNPDLEWQVRTEDFFSKSVNSPFVGWKMKGKAIATFVEGEIKRPVKAA